MSDASDFPQNDPDLDDGAFKKEMRLAEQAYNRLAEESAARDKIYQLIDQRIWMRRAVFAIAVAMLVYMGFHLERAYPPKYLSLVSFIASSPFAVVSLALPIVSMTSITIALLVGVFRRFTDKDMEALNGSAHVASDLGKLSGMS